MGLNQAAGLQGMLKEGHTHIEGVDDAVVKNIEAAKALAKITCSSLGPNGLNKLVINHLSKIMVTSDCSTILREMEVIHPAARAAEYSKLRFAAHGPPSRWTRTRSTRAPRRS